MNNSEMLKDLITIIYRAGEIVMDIYRSGNFDIVRKDDGSPVTRADLASDRYICNALRDRFDIPVVSEESEMDYEQRRSWAELFLVDPIDGTKDFISRNGEFTINVALIRDQMPVLGLVYAPALGELFYAEKGRGAWGVRGEEHVRLPETECAEMTLARSWFHDHKDTESFAEMNEIHRSRNMSSAIRLPRLAQGIVNVYAGFNRSKEWDIAAGHVLISESGGRIVDLETMAPPLYNKPDLRNHWFLACAGNVDFDGLHWPENKKSV